MVFLLLHKNSKSTVPLGQLECVCKINYAKKQRKKKQNEHNEDKSFFCFANDYKATTTCAFNWNMHELLKTRVITYKRERKEKRTKEKKIENQSNIKTHTHTHAQVSFF